MKRTLVALVAFFIITSSAAAEASMVRIFSMPALPPGKCWRFFHIALDAGWTKEDWRTLDRVIYRESRCQPTACSKPDRPDLRKCRDWGLTQINDYSWKRTVRQLGLEVEMLADPFWNLWVARWIYEYSQEKNGCGWQPWSIKCR